MRKNCVANYMNEDEQTTTTVFSIFSLYSEMGLTFLEKQAHGRINLQGGDKTSTQGRHSSYRWQDREKPHFN